MNLIVDGYIYQAQTYGGITRLYNEILPRMCMEEESLRISLVIQDRHSLFLPRHKNISLLTIPSQMYFPPTIFVREKLYGMMKCVFIKQKIKHFRNPIWHSTYYTLAGKWNGPVVVTVYDMIFEQFPDLFNTKGDTFHITNKRKSIEAADALICISETTRQEMESYYNCKGKSIHVISLAYSSSFKKLNNAYFEAEQNKPFLLYVGSRARYKNFSILIQAYSKLRFIKDIDLVVVGNLWTSEELRNINNLKLHSNIKLITNCSDDELCKLYNQAVAFVYPSLFEGFGIPLLEAMACNCPIVASNIPSTHEVAGNYPIYFEPTQLESLIESLNCAIMENKNSNRLLLSQEHLKLFSWEKTAIETLNVYRSFDNNSAS